MVSAVPPEVLLSAPSASKMSRAERPKSASRTPASKVMLDTSLPFGPLTGLETTIASIASKAQKGDQSGSGRISAPAPPAPSSTAAAAEGAERTRRPRPKSASLSGRGDWNRRWSSVPRTFEERATTAPDEKKALFFGPKHKVLTEKVKRLLDDDLAERKKESIRVKDGALRRQDVEEAILNAGKEMKPSGSCGRLFSDPPLLGTSESAVEWYLQKGR
jgi:hypothetical protein